MAQSTTHIGLPSGAVILDLADNTSVVSYVITTGGTDNLYTMNLSTRVSTLVASATSDNGGNGYFDEGNGIAGGQLSANGQFIFFTTGQKPGGLTPGNDGTQLNVKDLQSGAPPTNITSVATSFLPPNIAGPHYGQDGYIDHWYLGNASNYSSGPISDDGHTVAFGVSFTDFDDSHQDFDGGVIVDLVTGAVKTISGGDDVDGGSLTPDGKYLTYSSSPVSFVVDVAAADRHRTGGVSADTSDNGRYTVYSSSVTQEVHIHDYTKPGATGVLVDRIVSTNAQGESANAGAGLAGLSGDGRHLVFSSAATNLVPNDTDGDVDLFEKDLDTGAIRRVDGPGTFIGVSYDGTQTYFDDGTGVTVVTFSPPTLTLDPIAGDNYINAREGTKVLVMGTSDAIGRLVTINVPSVGSAFATVDQNGNWAAVLDTTGAGDGFANVHVSVTDAFGLHNALDRSIIIDRTPPAALNVASVAGDNIINAAEAAHAVVAGSVLNLSPTVPNSTEAAKIVITIDDGPSSTFLTQGAPFVVPSPFGFAINAAGVSDGLHTIRITAVDNAGNFTSVTKQVTIDKTPPTLAITSVSGDDVVSSGEAGTPQGVHGTSDAIGRTVTVSLDGVAVDHAVVQSDGSWVSIVDFSSAITGNHTITAAVSDAAGNAAESNSDVLVDRGFAFTRLSVGPNGEQSDGAGGIAGLGFPSLSADGTKLVFTGQNFNLMSTATGSFGLQVYVKDLVTGEISFVTPDPSMNSQFGAISPDGDQVVFISDEALDPNAPWFVQNHAYNGSGYFTYVVNLDDGIPHIRVFDSQVPDTYDPGFTTVQSLPIYPLSISSNGLDTVMIQSGTGFPDHVELIIYVAIDDSNVVLNGPDGVTGALTEIYPTFPSGGYSLFQASAPLLSADGSVVAFQGRFDADQPHGSVPYIGTQIFAGTWSGNQQTIALASCTADGTPMPYGAIDPALSADGKFVAFWGFGADGSPQVYVKDLTTGALNIASSDVEGNQGSANASDGLGAGPNTIAISGDGRYVAFTSDAVLTPDEEFFSNTPDLFVKDMVTGAIQRVPVPAGALDNGLTTQLAMTADGQYIVFTTNAALDQNDTNGVTDIYGISLAALNNPPPEIAINPLAGTDRLGLADISNHVIVSGTSDAIGGTVTLSLDGTALPGVVVAADGTWSTTINATLLADGSHRLQARVTDHGATGADGDRFTIDRVAPTVVLTSDKTHLAVGEHATITATFSEGISNLGSSFFTVHGGTLGPLTFGNDHTVTAVFTPTAGADFFSITANPSSVSDFAGNHGAAKPVTMTVGLALDGYLSGSLVFMDANGNGVYDDGEAATTTDETGHFVLSGGSGPLVLVGGVDIATGLPFNGVLLAPEGFTTITPLTTLAHYVQQETGGDTNSLVQLVNALAHASGVGDLEDVVASANLGDADAQHYLLAGVQLADAAALMSSALAGVSGKPFAEVYADVMQGLAHAIVTHGASTDLLQQVPATMSDLAQDYGLDPAIAQNVIETTNTIIQNIADAAADIPFGTDGAAFLEQLYAIARVAQGAASDAVGNPEVQEDDPFGTAAAGFTGDALQNAIEAAAPAAPSPIALTAANTAYTQDFDALNFSGASSHQLDLQGWLLHETGGGSRDDERYQLDTGAGSAGDTYAYGSDGSSDRALGSLRSDTLSSTFGAAFVNNTGDTISSLDISYVGEQWRLGAAGRADGLTFEYSLDATDLTTGTWTHVQALDFSALQTGVQVGATDGNASGFNASVAATIAGLNVANGATVFIRWTDTDADGDDDGLAVDNFALTAHTVDTTAPTVEVDQDALQDDPAGTGPIVFSVTFSEDVTGFDASDLDFSGSTVGGSLAAAISAGPTSNSYVVSVTGMTGTGDLTLKVKAGAAADAAGNQSLASTSIDNTVTYGIPVDATPPEVTINQADGQADPAGFGFIAFTVTFSEAVTGFTGADIDLSASTAAGSLVAAVTGGPTQYTVIVSGMTGPGDVIAKVPAGGAIDAAGNSNHASTSTDNVVTIPVDGIPFALSDHYAVAEGGSRTVSGPGVLGNDSDAGHASLFSGPAHGDVSFNSDGSFTYTPDAGFTGRDHFTYQASDGSHDSNVAIVTLRVFNIDAGSSHGEVLDGTSGDDLLLGRAGNDTLSGQGGDDRLDGGAGADEMHGGTGNDLYLVDDANDQAIENDGEGTDRVATTVTYTLSDHVENLILRGDDDIDGTGNGGDNRLVGNGGDNTLDGMAGDDVLVGGDGDDVLIGGGGRDVMTGGDGNDRYVFNVVSDSPAGAGRDVIKDFVTGDVIDVSGIDADTVASDDQAFSFIGGAAFSHQAGELQARFVGSNTLVSGDVDGNGHADFQVVLSGHVTLQASNFLL